MQNLPRVRLTLIAIIGIATSATEAKRPEHKTADGKFEQRFTNITCGSGRVIDIENASYIYDKQCHCLQKGILTDLCAMHSDFKTNCFASISQSFHKLLNESKRLCNNRSKCESIPKNAFRNICRPNEAKKDCLDVQITYKCVISGGIPVVKDPQPFTVAAVVGGAALLVLLVISALIIFLVFRIRRRNSKTNSMMSERKEPRTSRDHTYEEFPENGICARAAAANVNLDDTHAEPADSVKFRSVHATAARSPSGSSAAAGAAAGAAAAIGAAAAADEELYYAELNTDNRSLAKRLEKATGIETRADDDVVLVENISYE